MAHLTHTIWHGYETEPRRIEIPVDTRPTPEDPPALTETDIASAELRITGQTAIVLAAETDPIGYKLTNDSVALPATSAYAWSAEVFDTAGNGPIVVAEGTLRVSARVQLAA